MCILTRLTFLYNPILPETEVAARVVAGGIVGKKMCCINEPARGKGDGVVVVINYPYTE